MMRVRPMISPLADNLIRTHPERAVSKNRADSGSDDLASRSALSHPFSLTLFLNCTTSVLLGYYLGGRLSRLLPSPWDLYDQVPGSPTPNCRYNVISEGGMHESPLDSSISTGEWCQKSEPAVPKGLPFGLWPLCGHKSGFDEWHTADCFLAGPQRQG